MEIQCKAFTEKVGVLTTAFDAALTENNNLRNDLDAAKAQAAELMTQLEQAKNASSDIQSKLDDVNTELSITKTALEASKAKVLALLAFIAGSCQIQYSRIMSDSKYELSIRAKYFRHPTDTYWIDIKEMYNLYTIWAILKNI